MAAMYRKQPAGDPLGLFGSEEEDRTGDILRYPHSAQGNLVYQFPYVYTSRCQ